MKLSKRHRDNLLKRVSSVHSGGYRVYRASFSKLLTFRLLSINTPIGSGRYGAIMMVSQTDVTRLVCECGRSIRCGVSRGGQRLGFRLFFVEPEPGENQGRRVTNCPSCDARLDHRLLVRAAR